MSLFSHFLDRKLSKKIFEISIPVALQMLVQYVLTLTDTAFIGRFRPEGLSALFNAVTPYFMLNSFFFALTQGLTILIAQSLGAGKFKRAARYAESGIFFNPILSVVYFIIWFFFASPILALLRSTPEVMKMGVNYLHVMSFNFVFMGFSLTAASIFKGTGETFPILLASVVKTVLNIVLDWLLIFGHFGFPQLGIRGAALATVISEGAGTLLLLLFLYRQKKVHIVPRRIVRPNFHLYVRSFSLGLPAGLEFMLWSVGQTVLIAILNRVGAMAAAYYGVFNTIMNLSVYLYYGIGVAGMNLTAIAVGAKKDKEVGRVSLVTLGYGFLLCIGVALIFNVFSMDLLAVFTKSTLTPYQIRLYFLFLSFIIFPKMINVIVGSLIKGTGDTRWMLVTQIPGTLLIILSAYLVVLYWGQGFIGLLWVLFADEFWRAVVNAFKLRSLFSYIEKRA